MPRAIGKKTRPKFPEGRHYSGFTLSTYVTFRRESENLDILNGMEELVTLRLVLCQADTDRQG